MDQRPGRTFAEIEAVRKALSLAASDPQAERMTAIELRGAWLALCWVLDDEEHPTSLLERLKNLTEGRG